MFRHEIAQTSRAHTTALETQRVTITNDNTPSETSHSTVTPYHISHSTIPNLRSGQHLNWKSANINSNSASGDSHLIWDKNDIGTFFQNVKGLTYSHTGEDYVYYMTSTQAIGADIIGMAETNTAWQHHQLQASLTSWAQKHFGATNISFGYPDATTDPVPDKETFQFGGSITLKTGSLVPLSHGGDILWTHLVWDVGADTPQEESHMHSSPSLLHTELAQDQSGPSPLAAHSVKKMNTSVIHNNMLPQDHNNK